LEGGGGSDWALLEPELPLPDGGPELLEEAVLDDELLPPLPPELPEDTGWVRGGEDSGWGRLETAAAGGKFTAGGIVGMGAGVLAGPGALAS
jgi:hypothetical protein